jgi:predicted metal-dependent phosphoesterase TrpH
VPVRIEDAAGLLAFPLAEATVVLPAALDRAQGGQLRAQLLTLGKAQGMAAAPPPTGPVVVLATAEQEQALQAAGFDPRSWGQRDAQGYVALRHESGRALVGIWGRDGEGLARSVRVFLDLRRLLSGRELLIGDLHLHTMLSDGSGSPRQVLLACMAAGMDFAAITDHSFGGASYQGKAWCDRWVPSFTAIRGAEVQGADFEMLALGISRDVEAQPDPQQIAADIHAQGGTALLCHPYGPPYLEIMENLEDLGLDGIDRYTEPVIEFAARQQLIGRQPVVTAVTDSHDLSFVWPYRTLVFAADRSEEGILSAVREGYLVALNDRGLAGAPRLVDVMLALIGERHYLRARYEANAQARVEELARAWEQGGL